MTDHTHHEHDDFLTLDLEDGTQLKCEILGLFEAGGKTYIAVMPDDGSDDVYLYLYNEISEEEFVLEDIEDDDEFDRAAAEFERVMSE